MTSPFGAPSAPPQSPFGAGQPSAAPGLPADLASLFGAPLTPPRPSAMPKFGDLFRYDAAAGKRVGPLVLYKVNAYETGLPKPGNDGGVQDRATVDIAVLDGGPIQFGGDLRKGIPHDKTWDPANPPEPGWLKNLYISSAAVTPVMLAVYSAKKSGTGTGIALGRLFVDPATKPGYSDTYMITTNVPDPKDPTTIIRPAFTEADAQLAQEWLRKYPRFIDGL